MIPAAVTSPSTFWPREFRSLKPMSAPACLFASEFTLRAMRAPRRGRLPGWNRGADIFSTGAVSRPGVGRRRARTRYACRSGGTGAVSAE